jgi:hypothetical protein
MIQHPLYDDRDVSNDIALIKLKKPVAFTEEVRPVCMPAGRDVEIGDKLIVTGWVRTLLFLKSILN